MQSTINLFNALPVNDKVAGGVSNEFLTEFLKKGIIFSPELFTKYSEDELRLFNIGSNPEDINNSFQKSWKKVKEASMEQLVLEQVIHYITTYGFENMGIFSEDTVFVPKKDLDIPELKKGFKFTVIKAMTKDELEDRLMEFLGSGIALKDETIKDVVDLITYLKIEDLDSIKNTEVRTYLYEYLGKIPKNPTEMLRLAVYKATQKTLLIKSPAILEEIKESNNISIVRLFEDYDRKYGFDKLSEIFLRFKPIFLALRTNSRMKAITNKLRRLAKQNHKPMPEDFLNTVTANLKTLDFDKLEKELKEVNIFRKIRLAYSLKYRSNGIGKKSIVYKIRNGKGFATEFSVKDEAKARKAYKIVEKSIIDGLNVEGKNIYIPANLEYALPATEKQFTGNLPSGSYVKVDSDMLVGVTWKNNNNRIDLDLACIAHGEKIGWDGEYRNKNLLFSGDVTDAPRPASELFYVGQNEEKAYILTLNYYNFREEEVPFKIVVGKEKAVGFGQNYMVDPNNIIIEEESMIGNQQKILGLLVTSEDENRFYFSETHLGTSISSSDNEFCQNARKYLFDFYSSAISLNEILAEAGANVITVETIEDEEQKIDIDLSPENLSKDTIINLLK